MRFIHLYLIGYFVLVIGAGLALWQAGVLVTRVWRLSGSILRPPSSLVGLGIMLAVTRESDPPRIRPANSLRRSLRPSGAELLARVMVPCPPAMRVHALRVCPLLVRPRACCVPRCKEDGRHDHAFTASRSTASRPWTKRRLKAALATAQSSKIPWGKKVLLRPLAVRRGPEAHPGVLRRSRLSRRARHRLRREAQRQAGRGRYDRHDRRRRARHGRRHRLRRLRRAIPADHLDEMKNASRSRSASRAIASSSSATHEMALNELRDHGYPYAKVDDQRGRRAGREEAALTFTAEPGKLAHFGPVEIVGNKSVGENIIRRAADLQARRPVPAQPRPGHAAPAVRHGAVPVREHRSR